MRDPHARPSRPSPRSVSFLTGLAVLSLAVLSPRAGIGAAPEGLIAQRGATESARKIPVAASVDVVVVGGSSGAVAAASAAAQAGAKVILVAPRPYLGEDLAGPMRLWLEEGEVPASPLAKRLFSPEAAGGAIDVGPAEPGALAFTYEADLPSAAQHKDSTPPSRLRDGAGMSAARDSVQYDGDVAVTADLGTAQFVKQAKVVFFKRNGDFDPATIVVAVSKDKADWKDVATLKCETPPGDERGVVSTPINDQARYLRFSVKRTEGAKRILLGKIVIIGPEKTNPGSARARPESLPALASAADAAGVLALALADAPPPAPAGGAAKDEKDAKDARARGPFRPMQIKKGLDDELFASKVQFLYSSLVTDVLRDAQGNLAGVVIANRAGRQAVLAKVVIDATDRAWTARLAGAEFRPYPAGPQEFKFVTVGGTEKKGDAIVSVRKTGFTYATAPAKPKKGAKPDPAAKPGQAELIEYTLRLPMADGSFASFAKAEHAARDLTYDETIAHPTDELFQVPPDALKSAAPQAGAAFPGADRLDLGACRPAGERRLFVLSGCADLPREQAAQLMRPLAYIDLGARVGAAAAAEAKALPEVSAAQATVAAPAARQAAADVKEMLEGLRPGLGSAEQPTVASPARTVPIFGEYDVVVIGGGTGGAPAGIGAARAKARTLVIEYLHGLGGVGTTGMIATYYHGFRGGFNAEIPSGNSWNPIEKAEWWRKTNREAGAEIWFGCIGAGAYVENGKVLGTVVVTPQGRGVVLAKCVIDSTGAADIAAAAGAPTVAVGSSGEPAVQGTGLPPLRPGVNYINTDFTIADETDLLDVWHLFAYAKRKYPTAFDQGQLIDSRERRRIVGDETVTLTDVINGRTYPDTIHIAQSDFDTHGFTVDPYTMIEHPNKKRLTVNVPYRALLPKGLDRILVTGLGISADRDALPLVRMQPDIQNQGYAAGVVAAAVARDNKSTREVDLYPLRQHFVQMDILPARAMQEGDNYPLPDDRIAKAVADAKDGNGAAVIMTHREKALPLVKEAYAKAASPEEKLTYARILGLLGDATGAATLAAEVEGKAWDRGWDYRGMGQFGGALSPLDTAIVALGRTKDKRALPAILARLKELDAKSAFSHHRAVALALEALGDPAAAGPLAELLAKPGMTGYVFTSVDDAARQTGTNTNDNSTRNTSLRELSLARALYRCGDKDGVGEKILRAYTGDLRSYIARHAKAVLAEKPGAAR